MDCTSCYMSKSRWSVGIANAEFEDAMDGAGKMADATGIAVVQELDALHSNADKRKSTGIEEAVEEEELTDLSNSFSSSEDDCLPPGSSQPRAWVSGDKSLSRMVSGKPGPAESRPDSSRSSGASKVPSLGSMLGTAGTAGFGKAMEVLDTIGCLVTTLSPDGGFVSRVKTKGSKISILAFEVANTILKGACLMQSLSKETIAYFKEVVLSSEGVRNLISSDMTESLRIASTDKREELKIFSQEIVRFGNRCKDPQWHNLDRYFAKLESEITPQKQQLKETAISEMQKLMALVQRTTDLYHELHALESFEQDYRRKLKEKENSVRFERGDTVQVARQELKSQSTYVKNLKKRSLWSKTLEDVVEKLVDIVQYLHVEINDAFGTSDGGELRSESTGSHQRLGPAGLALHYANIIIQIYGVISRSGHVPANTRDALYRALPSSVRLDLPARLRSSLVPRKLTVEQIRALMDRTLQWLVPMAINTTSARRFARFSEWAKSGAEVVGRAPGQPDTIETLYHADKAKTEAYILELVVWLHYFVNQSIRPVNANDRSMTN